MSRRALRLEFGARVHHLPAPSSLVARDVDGRSYSFEPAPKTGGAIPSLLAQAFILDQSKNASSSSRRRTNATMVSRLRMFATWCSKCDASELSSNLLTDYRGHVFKTMSATSAQASYGVAARATRTLISHGFLKSFPVPRNATQAAVDASQSSSGASLATALDGPASALGADEFNERAMAALIKTVWHELDELFGRIERARVWREEAGPDWAPPAWFTGFKELSEMGESELLSLIKSIHISRRGDSAPAPPDVALRHSSPSWRKSLVAISQEWAYWHGRRIGHQRIEAAINDPRVPLIAVPGWAKEFAPIQGDRASWVKLAVQLLQMERGGLPLDAPDVIDALESSGTRWGRAFKRLRLQARQGGASITTAEIASHFHPTAPMVGLCLALLCAAQVNPVSAAELEADSLVDDEREGFKRLRWAKHRAGGEQLALPFPVGGPRARTIPRLVERYLSVSAELRALAPEPLHPALWLWINDRDRGAAGVRSCLGRANLSGLWGAGRDYLAGAYRMKPTPEATELLGPLAPHLKEKIVSLALIRATAINIASARLGRHFGSVAEMDGRADPLVLERHYLRNAQTRDHLDRQVRQGQASLERWLAEPPLVLPPEPAKVSETLGIERTEAERITRDELNLGNGASLIDGRAIFIDTPLNALRVMQWLAHLRGSRARLMRDSPGRWAARYAPQHALFEQALHALSRRSRAGAEEMGKSIALPFPELH